MKLLEVLQDEKVQDRYWRKVKIEKDCHRWIGSINSGGYGNLRLKIQGIWKTAGSHQVAYVLHNQKDVEHGLEIMHSCDNRWCVNPDHLSVGTKLKNQQDKAARGRTRWGDNRGSKQGLSVLVEEDIPVILSLSRQHYTHKDIADKFGVCRETITSVLNGKTWGHLTNLDELKAIREDNIISYKAISPEGEVFITSQLPTFLRERSLDIGASYRVLYKQQRQHKGWRFEYIT